MKTAQSFEFKMRLSIPMDLQNTDWKKNGKQHDKTHDKLHDKSINNQ